MSFFSREKKEVIYFNSLLGLGPKSKKHQKKMSSTVYLVIEGVAHEGYTVLGVYTNRQEASLHMRVHVHQSRKKWEPQKDGSYESGCDYLEIEEYFAYDKFGDGPDEREIYSDYFEHLQDSGYDTGNPDRVSEVGDTRDELRCPYSKQIVDLRLRPDKMRKHGWATEELYRKLRCHFGRREWLFTGTRAEIKKEMEAVVGHPILYIHRLVHNHLAYLHHGDEPVTWN